MIFPDAFNPLYSLSGFCVGMLVGITGVGGGSLMTPLLVLLLGVHPTTAVGTDLLYAAITKSAGTAVHRKHGNINWRIVGTLASGSVPAAILTLWLMSGVDRHSTILIRTVTSALGWMLLLTALLLLFRKQILEFAVDRMKDRRPPGTYTVAAITWVLGLGLGSLVTLTSVGAGALGVTILIALYPRLDIREVVGSDIVHAVPLTFVAGMGYWAIGEIDWGMLLALLLGSIPGIMIGSHFAPRMHEAFIRTLLAITLVLVGIKLIAS